MFEETRPSGFPDLTVVIWGAHYWKENMPCYRIPHGKRKFALLLQFVFTYFGSIKFV